MELLRKEFPVQDRVKLDVDRIPTTINIQRTEGSVTVIVSGPEKYKHEVSASIDNDLIKLRGPKSYGGNIVNNGKCVNVTSFSGGNMSIIGGRVIIDGVDVTNAESEGREDEAPLTFTVHIPENSDLILGDVGRLTCTVPVRTAELNMGKQSRLTLEKVDFLHGSVSGQTNLHVRKLTASPLQLEASGQSHIVIEGLEDCEVDFSTSGQGSAEFQGSFSSVDISARGQTNVQTRGPVTGDYTATAKGMSSVIHCGGVAGKVYKSHKGMASVSIN